MVGKKNPCCKTITIVVIVNIEAIAVTSKYCHLPLSYYEHAFVVVFTINLICFEEATKDNPLFRPCNCKGSVAYVHHACLLRWATESDRMECELCGGKFRVPRGMSQIVPQRAVLSRACALAQNSAALSSRIFAILPVHSGTLTESSTIL